jgi:hypothetical protein
MEHLRRAAPAARVISVVFVPTHGDLSNTDTGEHPGQDQHEHRLRFEDVPGLNGAAHFVVITDGSLPRSFDIMHDV